MGAGARGVRYATPGAGATPRGPPSARAARCRRFAHAPARMPHRPRASGADPAARVVRERGARGPGGDRWVRAPGRADGDPRRGGAGLPPRLSRGAGGLSERASLRLSLVAPGPPPRDRAGRTADPASPVAVVQEA